MTSVDDLTWPVVLVLKNLPAPTTRSAAKK
jgi:hypothetical protein